MPSGGGEPGRRAAPLSRAGRRWPPPPATVQPRLPHLTRCTCLPRQCLGATIHPHTHSQCRSTESVLAGKTTSREQGDTGVRRAEKGRSKLGEGGPVGPRRACRGGQQRSRTCGTEAAANTASCQTLKVPPFGNRTPPAERWRAQLCCVLNTDARPHACPVHVPTAPKVEGGQCCAWREAPHPSCSRDPGPVSSRQDETASPPAPPVCLLFHLRSGRKHRVPDNITERLHQPRTLPSSHESEEAWCFKSPVTGVCDVQSLHTPAERRHPQGGPHAQWQPRAERVPLPFKRDPTPGSRAGGT